MKNIRLILAAAILFALSAGAHLLARQNTGAAPQAPPCTGQVATEKKKEEIEHDPLIDPAVELAQRAQKKMDEKNFNELKDAAAQLATISGKMSDEIDRGGQYVLSVRVLSDLDQIEKLTKTIRSRSR